MQRVSGGLLLALIAVVIVVGWYVDVRRRPNRRCRACNGTGKNSRGVRWGTCHRCGGVGHVHRIGAGNGR
jgi:DnaJ-class molecular chaperone